MSSPATLIPAEFILLTEQPASGQFIGVWIFRGVVWCSTYRCKDGRVERYNEDDDKWVAENQVIPVMADTHLFVIPKGVCE